MQYPSPLSAKHCAKFGGLDKIFTAFRNTRLVSSYHSVLASEINSISVHSAASKHKTLICLALTPNGTGFLKRDTVRKREDLREAFIHVELNVHGGKDKLCLTEEAEPGEHVNLGYLIPITSTSQQVRGAVCM